MQYIALKEMDTISGHKKPGDLVPEAATWDRVWFSAGHVAAYPENMIDEVRRSMGLGHLEMHGQEFGQHLLGLSQSPGEQGQVSSASAVNQGGPAPIPQASEAPVAPLAKGDADPAQAPQVDVSQAVRKGDDPLGYGETPPGKERITGDGGAIPAPGSIPTAPPEDADDAAGEAQSDDPTQTPDPAAPARPRRRRRG